MEFDREVHEQYQKAYALAQKNRFLRYWPVIERAFYKSFEGSLRISAADALVVVLNKYSFEQIITMDPWILARIFQTFWKELYALSFQHNDKTETNPSIEILQTA